MLPSNLQAFLHNTTFALQHTETANTGFYNFTLLDCAHTEQNLLNANLVRADVSSLLLYIIKPCSLAYGWYVTCRTDTHMKLLAVAATSIDSSPEST